jgi:hypothetical protein
MVSTDEVASSTSEIGGITCNTPTGYISIGKITFHIVDVTTAKIQTVEYDFKHIPSIDPELQFSFIRRYGDVELNGITFVSNYPIIYPTVYVPVWTLSGAVVGHYYKIATKAEYSTIKGAD